MITTVNGHPRHDRAKPSPLHQTPSPTPFHSTALLPMRFSSAASEPPVLKLHLFLLAVDFAVTLV